MKKQILANDALIIALAKLKNMRLESVIYAIRKEHAWLNLPDAQEVINRYLKPKP